MLTHIHMMVYTWWCWHIYKGDEVGVDVINSAMKRRREGLGTPPVECPLVECGQSNGATGALYRKDRVSQSGPDAGHVVIGRWGLASGQWQQRARWHRSSTERW